MPASLEHRQRMLAHLRNSETVRLLELLIQAAEQGGWEGGLPAIRQGRELLAKLRAEAA